MMILDCSIPYAIALNFLVCLFVRYLVASYKVIYVSLFIMSMKIRPISWFPGKARIRNICFPMSSSWKDMSFCFHS